MRKYLRLLSFIKPHKNIFALAVCFMLISSLFDCISLTVFVPLADRVLNNSQIIFSGDMPDFVGNLVNKLNSIPQVAMLKMMVLAGIVLLVLKNSVLYIQQVLMSDVSLRVVRDVRNIVYTKLHDLSLDFYARNRAGELVSRVSYDVGVIQNSVFEGVTDLVYQSFKVLILGIAIFKIHWRLALISVALLPLVAIPIIQVGKKLRKISSLSQEKQADIVSALIEAITGIRVVKAFSMEQYEVGKFSKLNSRFYKLMIKQVKRMNAISPVTELVGMLGAVFVLYYGGLEVIKQACEKLGTKHKEHIAVYGAHNEERLTGMHETCSINEFRYGVSDRGASVRIPMLSANSGKGYLEDRRPAANCDPYKVCSALIETVCSNGESQEFLNKAISTTVLSSGWFLLS